MQRSSSLVPRAASWAAASRARPPCVRCPPHGPRAQGKRTHEEGWASAEGDRSGWVLVRCPGEGGRDAGGEGRGGQKRAGRAPPRRAGGGPPSPPRRLPPAPPTPLLAAHTQLGHVDDEQQHPSVSGAPSPSAALSVRRGVASVPPLASLRLTSSLPRPPAPPVLPPCRQVAIKRINKEVRRAPLACSLKRVARHSLTWPSPHLAVDRDPRQGGPERARRHRPAPDLGEGHHPLCVPPRAAAWRRGLPNADDVARSRRPARVLHDPGPCGICLRGRRIRGPSASLPPPSAGAARLSDPDPLASSP